MKLNKNTKAMVPSLDEDSDLIVAVVGVLQVPYLLRSTRLPTTNVNRFNKRKWFHILKKHTRSKRYPTETMTVTDYADDQVLLVNTLAQAE